MCSQKRFQQRLQLKVDMNSTISSSCYSHSPGQADYYKEDKKYPVLNEYHLVYVTDCVFYSVIISELSAALSDILIGRSQ